MRSPVKPWICLLIVLALCCAPAWSSGSEPEKKSEDEKKKEAVPQPEPSPRVKAKLEGQKAAPVPDACEKPRISAIVNTLEDVYGHAGTLETLPEGAEQPAAPTAATPVTWREVDQITPTPAAKPATEADPQPDAKPRNEAKKEKKKKSGDEG